jgi:hypothetical protein
MKGQMHPKETFIIAKESMEIVWARCILKKIFTKANVPIGGL